MSSRHLTPTHHALLNVPADVLEDYVNGRIQRFVEVLADRLVQNQPGVSLDAIRQSFTEARRALSAPTPSIAPGLDVPKVVYQLVFRHDCLALGCLDGQCTLCQHNPARRCTMNFDRKYLVNDGLKARCGAAIRIELTDASTGQIVENDMPGLKLEMCVLDGNAYEQKFVETGRVAELDGDEPDEELEACALLMNKKKNTPLLVSAGNASNDSSGRLIMSIQHGRVVLPDVSVTDSSEAILLGRKPPFRLLVRATWSPTAAAAGSPGTAAGGGGAGAGGTAAAAGLLPAGSSGGGAGADKHLSSLSAGGGGGGSGGSGTLRNAGPAGVVIRHAISEGFVVATRRTRTAGKADIPSVEDPISKLEHMGKETVKKLADIATAAAQAGIELPPLPDNCITKVGEFKRLALHADSDGQLRQRLQHVLKLSKDKWDEAREHALRAVVADSRPRAWYADPKTCTVGLLFACRLGCVDLERPQALLQSPGAGSGMSPQITLMGSLTPAQRDLVRQLLPRATASWWTSHHEGWAIYAPPLDADASVLNILAVLDGAMSAHAGVPTTTSSLLSGPNSNSQLGRPLSNPGFSMRSLSGVPSDGQGSAGGATAPATHAMIGGGATHRATSMSTGSAGGGAAANAHSAPPPGMLSSGLGGGVSGAAGQAQQRHALSANAAGPGMQQHMQQQQQQHHGQQGTSATSRLVTGSMPGVRLNPFADVACVGPRSQSAAGLQAQHLIMPVQQQHQQQQQQSGLMAPFSAASMQGHGYVSAPGSGMRLSSSPSPAAGLSHLAKRSASEMSQPSHEDIAQLDACQQQQQQLHNVTMQTQRLRGSLAGMSAQGMDSGSQLSQGGQDHSQQLYRKRSTSCGNEHAQQLAASPEVNHFMAPSNTPTISPHASHQPPQVFHHNNTQRTSQAGGNHSGPLPVLHQQQHHQLQQQQHQQQYQQYQVAVSGSPIPSGVPTPQPVGTPTSARSGYETGQAMFAVNPAMYLSSSSLHASHDQQQQASQDQAFAMPPPKRVASPSPLLPTQPMMSQQSQQYHPTSPPSSFEPPNPFASLAAAAAAVNSSGGGAPPPPAIRLTTGSDHQHHTHVGTPPGPGSAAGGGGGGEGLAAQGNLHDDGMQPSFDLAGLPTLPFQSTLLQSLRPTPHSLTSLQQGTTDNARSVSNQQQQYQQQHQQQQQQTGNTSQPAQQHGPTTGPIPSFSIAFPSVPIPFINSLELDAMLTNLNGSVTNNNNKGNYGANNTSGSAAAPGQAFIQPGPSLTIGGTQLQVAGSLAGLPEMMSLDKEAGGALAGLGSLTMGSSLQLHNILQNMTGGWQAHLGNAPAACSDGGLLTAQQQRGQQQEERSQSAGQVPVAAAPFWAASTAHNMQGNTQQQQQQQQQQQYQSSQHRREPSGPQQQHMAGSGLLGAPVDSGLDNMQSIEQALPALGSDMQMHFVNAAQQASRSALHH